MAWVARVCGMIREGTGSTVADRAGERKQSSRSGKEHRAGSRKQIRGLGRGHGTGSRRQKNRLSRSRGLEWHSEAAGLICCSPAEKVGSYCCIQIIWTQERNVIQFFSDFYLDLVLLKSHKSFVFY